MSRNDEYEIGPADRDAVIDGALGAPGGDAEAAQEVTEIRESIEQTRAEMSETIDEIQERLSPAHLKEQVKGQVKEQYEQAKETVREATIGKVEDMVERVSDTVSETRRSIVDAIKENPIPAALVGVGLAWMWMNGRSDSGSDMGRYGDRYRGGRRYDQGRSSYTSVETSGFARQSGTGVWDRTTDAAENLASKAKEKVGGAVDQAQETAGYLADQAQYQARRAEDQFKVALRESPLAVGAVALALGAAVGLALPQTQKENELMGEARDTLVDKAQSAAQGTLGEVQRVAERVTDEVVGASNQAPQGRQGSQQSGQSNQGGQGSQPGGQHGGAGKGR